MVSSTDDRQRKALSVVRIITENPGLTAEAIGRRLGIMADDPGRPVRELIREARLSGEPISIGADGKGYYYLGEDGVDDGKRADLVKHHRARTRSHLAANALLLRQIGQMTAAQVAQMALFELLVPATDDETGEERPDTWRDLARLPVDRRAGMFHLFRDYLDAMDADPQAFAYERAIIADSYGRVFISKAEADKLAQAKKLLEEVGV